MSVDESREFTERLHHLALVVAELSGKVEALVGQSKTNYDHLVEKVEQVNHRRRNTDATLEKAVDLLHEYPKPHVIDELIEDVEGLREWRSKALGFVAALSVMTSLVTAVVVAIITRSLGG